MVKPGYTTTEFWVTLLTVAASAVVAVLALFGVVVHSNLTPLVSALATLAAAVASAVYAHSRATVKAAVAPVRVPPLPPSP